MALVQLPISIFKLQDLREGPSPSDDRMYVFSFMGKVWDFAGCLYHQLHRQRGVTSVCLSLLASSSAYGFLIPDPPLLSYLPNCLPCVLPAAVSESLQRLLTRPRSCARSDPPLFPLSAPSVGVVQLLGLNPRVFPSFSQLMGHGLL